MMRDLKLRPLAAAVMTVWAGGAVAADLMRVTGLSADGSTAVGYLSYGAKPYKWTESGGLEILSIPQGRASGVSADGSVIVGTVYPTGTRRQGFVWSGGTTTSITVTGQDVYANAVSGDGSTVVGEVYNPTSYTGYAYYWTSAGVVQSIGTLSGDAEAGASAVNADGSVIVGTSYGSGGTSRAFRWTSSGMTALLSSLPSGYTKSYAIGVSSNGNVVVGNVADATYKYQPFRWTSSGTTYLGHLGSNDSTYATAVSGDGNVIVGYSSLSTAPSNTTAFRWSSGSGMQSVTDWLTANGVTVASGVVPRTAYGTNSNGCVVAGELSNGDAYIARAGCGGSSTNALTAFNDTPGGTGGSGSGGSGGSGSSSGSGLISVQQIANTLMQAAANAGVALQQAGVTLHGAHSRPLSRRVDAGRNAFWVAGDLGHDDHGDRDGPLGLVEVGFGRNFGSVQINAGVGHAWARLDQPLGSHVDQDGTFLFAEGSMPLSATREGGLYGVLMGYHYWGRASVRRGYLNAGLPDASTGKPDNRSWAVSLGLEWQNLVQGDGLSVSPYANVTHTRARVDAYTETGGGFPAAFVARSESTDDLRLGVNLSKTLGQATVLGIAEYIHRFNDTASNVTATILGPGGFTVTAPGQNYERDWLRVGLGVEGSVGGGLGSLMLNATSKGEMPSYWLAASWRIGF